MSDTPETDSNIWERKSFVFPGISEFNQEYIELVNADLARKLERERNEARDQNDKLRDIANQAIEWLAEHEGEHSKYVHQLRAELDKLKECAK